MTLGLQISYLKKYGCSGDIHFNVFLFLFSYARASERKRCYGKRVISQFRSLGSRAGGFSVSPAAETCSVVRPQTARLVDDGNCY